jgi:NAD(P)-dependent dehydrogenase (short-subunit alcohol dehydrogenase family)
MNESTPNPRTWFISGCLAGMGRPLTEAILQRGDQAFITARDPAKVRDFAERFPDRATVMYMDVAHPDSIHEAVGRAFERFPRIDVLVNNAGYGLQGAVEEVSMAQVRRQFDTNFFGLTEVIQAVLPHMRKARSGHIVNMSSVGGLVATAGLGIYHATQFALEGLSEALAQEVNPLGIGVTLVEAGAFASDWAGGSLLRTERVIEDYSRTRQAFRDDDQTHGRRPGDPQRAVEAILLAVSSPRPPLRLVLGADALAKVRRKIAGLEEELRHWEALSRATGPETGWE